MSKTYQVRRNEQGRWAVVDIDNPHICRGDYPTRKEANQALRSICWGGAAPVASDVEERNQTLRNLYGF